MNAIKKGIAFMPIWLKKLDEENINL